MVMLVAVVVSKHPAIVHTTNPVIDVSETVAHNLAVLSLHTSSFNLAPVLGRVSTYSVWRVFVIDGFLGAFFPTTQA